MSATAHTASDAPSEPSGVRRGRLAGSWRRFRFLHFWSARLGLGLLGALVLLALLGPVVAPYSPTDIVGVPVTGPSSAHLLGTDFLGRDGLSRVLYGGRTVIGLSLIATLVAYLIGLPAGLLAGYSQSKSDPVIMRSMDVLLAFPPLLFVLVVATGAHDNIAVLVIAVGVISAPGLTRIVRSATLTVSRRGYVEAAVARGERTITVLWREILPNILGVILADVGLRFGGCVLAMAAVNFLGVGLQPPTSDWALMVAENRTALNLQPWVVLVPALLIALLVVGANLVADGIARSLGRSVDSIRAEATGQ